MKLGIMGVGFGKGVRIDEDKIRADTMLIGAGKRDALEPLAGTVL